jgi:hypothetical protein
LADVPTRGGQAGRYLQTPYEVNVSWGNSRSVEPKQPSGSDWFGPLAPMTPIAPPQVTGRQWDYQSGYNLHTKPRIYQSVSFESLRALADNYDLLRLVIETRKDQMRRMTWAIRPTHPFEKKDVREQQKRATNFFNKPDGFHDWADWLSMILEEVHVTDATTLYRQRNRAGKLIELLPLDGATIKPVIDNFGRTPRPYKKRGRLVYPVAYQQILKGYPAVNYSLRDLIYKPRNVRTTTPYGFSPTEQIISTVNIALRRQAFTTAYFSEGNIPDSLIGVPDTWTPDQIQAYQNYWDTYFEGDAGRRRKAKFVPGGVAKTFIQTQEPDLKAEFDDWLARIVCFAFSVSPQALVKNMNRATGQLQKAQAEEEGMVPIMQWVKALVDPVIQEDLECPDVEFDWAAEDALDESAQAAILDQQVKAGIISINEARASKGLDPIPDPAFDKPKPYTAMGYVEVDANSDEAVKRRIAITGEAPQTQPGASAPKGTQGKPANKKPTKTDSTGERPR